MAVDLRKNKIKVLHNNETKERRKLDKLNLLLWVLWPIRERGDMAKTPSEQNKDRFNLMQK